MGLAATDGVTATAGTLPVEVENKAGETRAWRALANAIEACNVLSMMRPQLWL